MPTFTALIALFLALSAFGQAQSIPTADTDADGLSDALEQRLLVQFEPTFMISQHDCAGVPAEFKTSSLTPQVSQRNGTIYGQASLVSGRQVSGSKVSGSQQAVEIHYYHLWEKDCGEHGHPLDTEHVAVLIRPSSNDLDRATWRAAYWYAAAHEHTVCDVSQITRASTLGAEDHGPAVWISPGKHASYLQEQLCHAGCGADRCEALTPLPSGSLINLGEPGHPMNAILFEGAPQWPLEAKMSQSNFSAESLARLDALPGNEIAWVIPGRHPTQGIIANSAAVESALAISGSHTTGALSKADESTGNALTQSARNTTRALGKATQGVAHALSLKRKTTPADGSPESGPKSGPKSGPDDERKPPPG